MTGLPLGLIILIIMLISLVFDLGNNILKSLKVNKVEALILLVITFIGSYVNYPFEGGTLNLGGIFLPLVSGFLIIKRSSLEDINLIVLATGFTAVGFYLSAIMIGVPIGLNTFTGIEYYTPILAAILALIIGSNLSNSFISAILGILLGDILYYFTMTKTGKILENTIGGGGIFDSIFLAGIIAILTCGVKEKIFEMINFLRDKYSLNPPCKKSDIQYAPMLENITLKGVDEIMDSKFKAEFEENCPGGACIEEETCPGGACIEEEACPGGACAEEEVCPGGACAEEETCPGGACAEEEACPGGACAEEAACPDGACAEEAACPGGACEKE